MQFDPYYVVYSRMTYVCVNEGFTRLQKVICIFDNYFLKTQ